MRTLVLVLLVTCGWATQLQDATFISPIVDRPFQVQIVPINVQDFGTHEPADMGVDADTCRHHSGISEYDLYISTCPYTLFSALSVEWDERSGRFTSRLTPEFQEWVRSKDGFNTEWVELRNRVHRRYKALGRMPDGGPVPAANKFVLRQQDIPLELKYRAALRGYEKRRTRASLMGKVALMGSWSLRVHLNRPINDSDLQGGIRELNDLVMRRVDDGEQFQLDKWYDIYHDLFNRSSLSDEAYFIAGSVLLGFAARKGYHEECVEIIAELDDYFKGTDNATKMRGLVRERRRMYQEYQKMTNLAVNYFIRAIKEESFARPRLPSSILIVAEGLRRLGREREAMDWYLTLAGMEETNPRMREDMRAMNRFPGPEAPWMVHLGWTADEQIAALTEQGVVHPGTPSGDDAPLCNAILYEGLGTPDFQNPGWEPRTDGNLQVTDTVLKKIGMLCLNYYRYEGRWPETMGELWISGAIKDWNMVNRFHCPTTGARLRYQPQTGAPRPMQVLVATSKPLPSNQGEVFGHFLGNGTVVWTQQPLELGSLYQER